MENNPIIKDFKEKSKSYYENVYVLKKDEKRIVRLNKVDDILHNFALENKRVLDAGSGPAVLYEVITRHRGLYTAIDLSPDNIFEAKNRIPTLSGFVGSIDKMEFEDGSFDFIVTMGCLEYIGDIRPAISEFSRVLKDGGILIASFANIKSPSRIWNETIIRFLIIIKALFTRKPIYKRYLTNVKRIDNVLNNYGFSYLNTFYINNSIFGYPMSELSFLKFLERKILSFSKYFDKFSSEYIIVYQKDEESRIHN